MKKILALFTPNDPSWQVFTAACDSAKAGPSLIRGIFLPTVKDPAGQYPFINDLSLAQPAVYEDRAEEAGMQLLKDKVALMTKECAPSGIIFRASSAKEISLEQIVDHSAFADLIIVKADTNFDEFFLVPSTAHLKDLLVDAHCPVLALNEYTSPVEKVILTYDGDNPSSMFAIRMFSYLFPEWRELSTVLVTVNPVGKHELNKEPYLSDWLQQHFPNLQIEILEGQVNEKVTTFIQQQPENLIVVIGAYGKDALSRLFHQSLANIVLKETKASLFITHRD